LTNIQDTVSLDSQEAASQNLDGDLRAQTEFFPRSWEKIEIYEELGSYIKSSLNVDVGKVSLTNRRIVFCGEIGAYMKLAAFGALTFLQKPKAPKIHFQVLLADILSIQIGKHGFSKVFVVTDKLNKTYKFQVRDYSKWERVLSSYGVEVQS